MPRGDRVPQCTAEQVIAAIQGTDGDLWKIADKLGVSRRTVQRYLKRWASVREEWEQEVEKIGDLAERNIYDAIRQRDLRMTRWYASNRLANRGYAPRREITGRDGEPLHPSPDIPKDADPAFVARVIAALAELGDGGDDEASAGTA